MRVHLLEHDPVDLSRTNATIWAEKKGYEASETYVRDTETLPSSDDFDWLMIMGGSQHVWEEEINPWLVLEKKLIGDALATGKIILGICFGAQLLAEVMGASVFPNEYKEIGWHEVTLTPEGRQSFLFRNVPEVFTTFHWHSDHFHLPPGCARLAFSKPTRTQAYISETHPAVGLQFHPEYTRELVTFFAMEYSHEWGEGQFVSSKELVLAQTERMPATYWLMGTLLDNMEREFGGHLI